MTIVSAADEGFAPHFAVTLHSAWTHNPTAEFLLLDCGIEPSSLAALTTFAVRRGIHFRVVKVDITLLRDLPTTKIWSTAIYARLLIPDLLPETMERILYLDADCIVVSDLTALWQTDIGEAAIAGVPDVAAPHIAHIERKNGTEVDEHEYVNSGVLLMNLVVWRRDKVATAAIAVIKQHQPRFLEQTAINAACAGKIAHVRDEWNFMLSQVKKLEHRRSPFIIHCTGPVKPWLHRDAFFADIYYHHRNQTPFPMGRPGLYRSKLRTFINLLLGRRKYRDRRILAQHYAAFTASYLAVV